MTAMSLGAGADGGQSQRGRRRSYDELARILNTFDTSFPDAIPNDSEDFDDLDIPF